MSFLVTKQAPDFTATAVLPDNSMKPDFKLSDYRGKYVILFFYPLDFTFVCPSEILAFDRALEAFKAKNCEIIGVSIDSQFSHWAWKNTPINQGGIGNIQYPLVSDLDKSISRQYGVLLDAGIALRGTFLIDRDGIVRHAVVNDLPLGRNIDEALRMVDALQFHEQHGDVCPANWQEGKEAMTPTAAGVAEYLAKHNG
ncbi:alkyl hydroperoxide reductase/ Thiol specific antioxidant/ Mal allergen [Desulfobulbus propionicus DSM 2032]|jgi:peroxiredoxin (alkyl hydroperoxide reductase subunit C)|uniref:Thioredoxin peroxidase n=1 Tax=Desulfobulbus propionicus (strain ATCC 33891 / DSM 2032 / VKM B-1956 / 1pr3) TaxID=577650 RepID=A0A7U3YPZ6_DESPD|nr:peroxiredoxin [Desulfobulbus propionicus]ADW19439.1 alkyl hydroperoxide reductase/ Thiol specific antioxidant/ Mal allergen [Desulfobulbus propionicus DSM 2032]